MNVWMISVLVLSACLWTSKSAGDDKWVERAARQAVLSKGIFSLYVVADVVTLDSNEFRRMSFEELNEALSRVGKTRPLEHSMLAPFVAAESRLGNNRGAAISRVHSYWSSGEARFRTSVNGRTTQYHGDDAVELLASPFDQTSTMFTIRKRESAKFPQEILKPHDIGLRGLSEDFLMKLEPNDSRVSQVENRLVIGGDSTGKDGESRTTVDAATGFILDFRIGRLWCIQQNPMQLSNGLLCPGRRVVAVASIDDPNAAHMITWYEIHQVSINDDIPNSLLISAAPGDRVHIDKSIPYFAARRTQVLKQEIPDLLAWFQERQRRF